MSAVSEQHGFDTALARLDRDHLLDRLQRLRSVLPVFAHELSTARRQAAQLRVENRRLTEQVTRLQRELRRAGPPVERAGLTRSDRVRVRGR